MPSAASYTNKLRFNTEARNTKIQYPGGVSTTFRPNLPAMCTDFNTSVSTTNNIISTIAGTGVSGYSGDGGLATNAQIFRPSGVAFDSAGNVYIADQINHRIRKVTVGGIISTIAGTGVAGYSGDGGPALSAQLNQPFGVAVDSAGNIYISDTNNRRLRKVDSITGIISTFAGTGVPSYSGDGGLATNAGLGAPTGVAFDSAGNVYIATPANHRIRKVTVGGIISTIAGTGVSGYSGDGGPATSASLFFPFGVAVDLTGNVYITDTVGRRIRKVTVGGIISTIAGTGFVGYSGDGGLATNAQIYTAFGVAVDPTGNVYIADTGNHRIRKVTVGGIISTIAGTASQGYGGDGGAATNAQLLGPQGLTLDSAGNIYIADTNNHRIRKVTLGTSVSTVYTPPWFTPLNYSVPCNCNAPLFT